MRKNALFLGLLTIVLLSPATMGSIHSYEERSMFRHGPERTGYSTSAAPDGGDVLWVARAAKERLRGLEESVEICKRMFTEETSSYKGKLYEVENVLNSPPPIQEHIPIMIGGGGEKRTLKIVAKHGDISHFFPWGGVEYVESKLVALRRHCKAVGIDFDEIRKGVGFVITLGSSEDEIEGKMKKMAEKMGLSMENAMEAIRNYRAHVMISGSVDDVAKELSNYRDLGLGLYTFSMLPSPTDEDIRLLYDEVMPVLC